MRFIGSPLWLFLFLTGILPFKASAKDYSVDDLIRITKTNDFQIRSRAETLFRAHEQIKVRVGRLLPSINFGVVSSVVSQDTFGLAASLLGFIFPSNWFEWKESKLFYEAEKHSYAALIADEINGVYSMTYRINLLMELLEVRSRCMNYATQVVGRIEELYAAGKLIPEDVFYAKSTIDGIATAKTSMKEDLKKARAELAKGIGLDIADWETYTLKSIEWPNPENYQEIKASDYYDRMISRSLELRSLDFMVLASKYALHTRRFEFLSPNGSADGSLGFGHRAYLAIGKSNTRDVVIKRESAAANLYLLLQTVVASYNGAIERHANAKNFLKDSMGIRNGLAKRMYAGTEFSSKDISEEIENSCRLEGEILSAKNQFILAQEQIHRLLLEAPYYNELLSLPPPETKNKHKLSIRQRLENRMINRAIAKGELKLPL